MKNLSSGKLHRVALVRKFRRNIIFVRRLRRLLVTRVPRSLMFVSLMME
jgi:hypothetical protein